MRVISKQSRTCGVPREKILILIATGAHRESTAEEIIDWSREKMANYKVPRHVEMLDELPMNASGKVQKFLLRERAEGVVSGK